jgi:hypothetical protein
VPDRGLAGRLRRVYQVAAHAVAHLSDLDLVRYETEVEESGADLSLWEEMAPVIRDMLMDVNALLTSMRNEFPPGEPLPAANARATAAVRAVREAMEQLAAGVTQLGEAMRNPQVVADRWNLLAEVQSLRTRFRDRAGEMVYESISAFTDVERRDVVPGYVQELRAALALRSTLADLLRVANARLEKVREAEPEDVQWNAQQLQTELDTFGRTAAYQALRAQDKRRLVERRSAVGRLATEASPSRAELLMLAQELRDFVASLGDVSQRAILQEHDRGLMALCGVRLERAAELLDAQPAQAAQALQEATTAGQALYGRSPALDLFLRRARKTQLTSLQGPELRTTVDTLRQLLADLPFQ